MKTSTENGFNLSSIEQMIPEMSGTVNSKPFVGKVLLRIKRKLELN